MLTVFCYWQRIDAEDLLDTKTAWYLNVCGRALGGVLNEEEALILVCNQTRRNEVCVLVEHKRFDFTCECFAVYFFLDVHFLV